MSQDANTIDSNVTGARIAEEETPCVLPAVPVWHPAEPNSYDDFGGQLTTKARTPISPSRQRKKGTPVDLDASGGYSQDFTETGLLRNLQGFMFADANIAGDTQPINSLDLVADHVVMTDAASGDSSYNAPAGLDRFQTDDLILVSGYGVSGNNGLKTVASAIAAKLTIDTAVVTEAAAPVSARIQKVGIHADDLTVVVNGTEISIVSTGAVDFTTWPIHTGSWLFIGSDTNAFTNAANSCFVRVDNITATTLTLGKTTKQMIADAVDTVVDIFLPVSIRNEPDPADIVKRSYQIERTVGRDDDGVMSEYLVNAMANELTLNIPQADFLSADIAYIAGDNQQFTGLEGVKTGTRPSLLAEDAYNTSSDVQRFRLATVVAGNPFPAALFGYATEGTITINNNGAPNKAIGVLGAISIAAGTFDVGGSLTAYFATMDAVKAVRNNADVTLDKILVKNNAGWVFDIPLIALGDGRLNVEANSPITLPLEMTAAESDLGHTLYIGRFQYLPELAD